MTNQMKLIVNDFSTSFWLKEAIEKLDNRDILDALRDVEILKSCLVTKLNEVKKA